MVVTNHTRIRITSQHDWLVVCFAIWKLPFSISYLMKTWKISDVNKTTNQRMSYKIVWRSWRSQSPLTSQCCAWRPLPEPEREELSKPAPGRLQFFDKAAKTPGREIVEVIKHVSACQSNRSDTDTCQTCSDQNFIETAGFNIITPSSLLGVSTMGH